MVKKYIADVKNNGNNDDNMVGLFLHLEHSWRQQCGWIVKALPENVKEWINYDFDFFINTLLSLHSR